MHEIFSDVNTDGSGQFQCACSILKIKGWLNGMATLLEDPASCTSNCSDGQHCGSTTHSQAYMGQFLYVCAQISKLNIICTFIATFSDSGCIDRSLSATLAARVPDISMAGFNDNGACMGYCLSHLTDGTYIDMQHVCKYRSNWCQCSCVMVVCMLVS